MFKVTTARVFHELLEKRSWEIKDVSYDGFTTTKNQYILSVLKNNNFFLFVIFNNRQSAFSCFQSFNTNLITFKFKIPNFVY